MASHLFTLLLEQTKWRQCAYWSTDPLLQIQLPPRTPRFNLRHALPAQALHTPTLCFASFLDVASGPASL